MRTVVSLRGDLLWHKVVAAMLHVRFLKASRIEEVLVQGIRGRSQLAQEAFALRTLLVGT